MSQGTTPPGWYDDGQGSQRWWDGTGWTDHTRPVPDADVIQPGFGAAGQDWAQSAPYTAPDAAPPSGGGGRGKGPLIAAIAGVGALLVVGAVALVLVLGRDGGDGRAGDAPTSSAATTEPTLDPSPDEPDPTADVPTDPGSESSDAQPVDPGPGPAGGASSVVQGFFDAVVDQDCDAFDALSNTALGTDAEGRDAALATLKRGCDGESFFGDDDVTGCDISLGDETISGDTSTVPYTITGCTTESNNDDGTFKMVVEDGEWRIEEFD